MRKIIQISAIGVENNMTTQSSHAVFALCDDGTVWQSWGARDWVQLSSIPQVACDRCGNPATITMDTQGIRLQLCDQHAKEMGKP